MSRYEQEIERLRQEGYTEKYIKVLRDCFKAYEEVNRKRAKSLDIDPWSIGFICSDFYNAEDLFAFVVPRRMYVKPNTCLFCDKRHTSNEHFNIIVLIGEVVKGRQDKKTSFRKLLPW
jgi:hypothetical protein